jgi:hypothetical protein
MATKKLKLPTIRGLPNQFLDEEGNVRTGKDGQPLNWLDVALSIYKEGGSDEEVMREFRITREVFSNLYTSDELFEAVIDHGRLCRHAWFLEMGRKNISNKGFNTPLWTFHMKNLYGWADKQEQTISEGELETLDKAEIDRRFAELEKKLRIRAI